MNCCNITLCHGSTIYQSGTSELEVIKLSNVEEKHCLGYTLYITLPVTEDVLCIQRMLNTDFMTISSKYPCFRLNIGY